MFAQKHPRLANFTSHRDTSMMEDCATRMSEPHGCNDDMAVVETFKEALKQRVGAERYQMWFTHGVDFASRRGSARTTMLPKLLFCWYEFDGQFALDRIKKNLLRELRGAAMQACGSANVELCLDEPRGADRVAAAWATGRQHRPAAVEPGVAHRQRGSTSFAFQLASLLE